MMKPLDLDASLHEKHFLFRKFFLNSQVQIPRKGHLLKNKIFSCILYALCYIGPFFGLFFFLQTVPLIGTSSISHKLPVIAL